MLENHIVSTVEAYGACFCWKIYSDTKFREKFNKFQREMKWKLNTTLGPSKNLDAQNQMRMITTNIAVIYMNCSLF